LPPDDAGAGNMARRLKPMPCTASSFDPHDAHVANRLFRCFRLAESSANAQCRRSWHAAGKKHLRAQVLGLPVLSSLHAFCLVPTQPQGPHRRDRRRHHPHCQLGYLGLKLRARIQITPANDRRGRVLALLLTHTTSAQDGQGDKCRTTRAPTCPVPPRSRRETPCVPHS